MSYLCFLDTRAFITKYTRLTLAASFDLVSQGQLMAASYQSS